jgi:hypothetical protein
MIGSATTVVTPTHLLFLQNEPITKVGPLKEEVVTGVQGSAATAVKVEDGGQIVNHSMGTITKGSKEVANP